MRQNTRVGRQVRNEDLDPGVTGFLRNRTDQKLIINDINPNGLMTDVIPPLGVIDLNGEPPDVVNHSPALRKAMMQNLVSWVSEADYDRIWHQQEAQDAQDEMDEQLRKVNVDGIELDVDAIDLQRGRGNAQQRPVVTESLADPVTFARHAAAMENQGVPLEQFAEMVRTGRYTLEGGPRVHGGGVAPGQAYEPLRDTSSRATYATVDANGRTQAVKRDMTNFNSPGSVRADGVGAGQEADYVEQIDFTDEVYPEDAQPYQGRVSRPLR